MEHSQKSREKFDDYAQKYDRLVSDNIRASGESAEYFLDYKLGCLERLGVSAQATVLDYGCGIGNLTARLCQRYREVHGYDPSEKSIAVARGKAPTAAFVADPSALPEAHFDAAVLSGVLHHVDRQERGDLLSTVRSKLRSGGKLVVFEHNPYNPVTRHAVSTCPFDDDAVLLWPTELRRLVAHAEFVDVRLDYIVFFPRLLARLRWLEPHLGWLFLGAQTVTCATKP